MYDSILNGPRGGGPVPLVNEDGSLTGPFGVLVHAPDLGGALLEVGRTLRYEGVLSSRVREIAILLTAVHRKSVFEYDSHSLVAREIGIEDVDLDALRRHDTSHWRDPIERLVHEAVGEMLASRSLTAHNFNRLLAALGATGTIELVVLVGYYDALALLLEVFGVSPPDR
jgi:4-carboxymuconolactone decarboxylase